MSNSPTNRTRREFIKKATSAAAGLSLGTGAFARSRAQGSAGPSDRIRVGFIGVGNRGSQLLSLFMSQPDVEVAALCDVYEPYLLRDRNRVDPRYLKHQGNTVPKMGETFAAGVRRFKDYRKLLEQKDVDAVCIATPDHWHALQTIHALKAGKDVFVEKPLTIALEEGRAMVKAQAAGKQVVAVGLNRRGSPVFQKLAREIPAGKIGKVTVARAFRINNMFPQGIGRMKPEGPPKDLDWDMWLGPRASRPYQYNIAPYMFRWWSDYSSQMGNWGVHYLDVIRWMMGEQAPIAVSAVGGKYAVDDDRDIPDTMEVTFEFASGAIASFCIYEASSGALFPYEVELRGTKGTLHAGENGYRISPTTRGQFQTWGKFIDAEESSSRDEAANVPSSMGSAAVLVRNFLDCIKSRQTPLCTLEEGHRSTSFAHLANIALKVGRRLQWDPRTETVTNFPEANKLLKYEYRKPWSLD